MSGGSKVAFVRSLPPSTDDSELVTLGRNWGKVSRVLTLQSKNIGFIEMESVDACKMMIDYYTVNPPQIRGTTVFFKFSDKSEIQSPSSTKLTSSGAPPPPAANRKVLLVTLADQNVPFSLDDLYPVFSINGNVHRMSSFNKIGKNQVLVQFGSAQEAHQAFTNLHGRNIGGCTLNIQWSTQDTLTFSRPDERNRDYVLGAPPSSMSTLPSTSMSTLAPPGGGSSSDGSTAPPMDVQHMWGYNDLQGQTQQTTSGWAADGTAPMGDSGMGSMSDAMMQPQQSGSQQNFQFFGNDASPLNGSSGAAPDGTVLFASGLNEAQITPGALFTLFGLYGEVQLVKVLFKKRDSALVQMSTSQQAQCARAHLNGIILYGKKWNVVSSKNQNLKLGDPQAICVEENLTATAASHMKSKYNPKHVAPPSPTIICSGLHPDITPEILMHYFTQYGEVQNFKVPNKGNSHCAIIEMDCIDSATTCIIALNNYALVLDAVNSCTLSLNFAKNSPQQSSNAVRLPLQHHQPLHQQQSQPQHHPQQPVEQHHQQHKHHALEHHHHQREHQHQHQTHPTDHHQHHQSGLMQLHQLATTSYGAPPPHQQQAQIGLPMHAMNLSSPSLPYLAQ